MAGPFAGPPVRAPRRWARALVTPAALAAVALAAPEARAQSGTLTFDGLTAVDASGVRYANNCYEESGFRVTLVGFDCGAEAVLGAWTPDNDLYYTGSPALHNQFGSSVDFNAVGGGLFSFRSIGLASFLGQLDQGVTTTVLFTGFLAAGGTVTQSVDVMGGTFGEPTMLTTRSFAGFNGLRSLRLTVAGAEGATNVQFDNVAFGASSVVPEPATVALFGAGLAGLGVLARRRRAS